MKQKKVSYGKGIKLKLTVDAYTACYLASDEVVRFLNNITYDDNFYYEFKLHRIDNLSGIYDNLIHVSVQNPNDYEYMHYGDLYYSEKRKDKEGNVYVWFKIENKALYTSYHKNQNILWIMGLISDELGLVDNNITTLDIACDSNVNWSRRIKRAVFNKNLLPIVNRKAYDDEREQIPGLRFSFGCNQLRLSDLAMYLKQNIKDGGFEMKGYDKGNEIEASEKQYISEWLGMKKPMRIELHLKNEQLTEFCSSTIMQRYFNIPAGCKMSPNELLFELSDIICVIICPNTKPHKR